MLNIFNKFFKKESYLGVDIGTTSIKVVELISGGKKSLPILKSYSLLESYGHLERPNNAIQTSTLKMLENETAELLKIAVKNSNATTREAVAALPSFAAFTTLLEIPEMTDADTNNAMNFQAKQYIPLPLNAVTIDWIKVGEKQNESGNTIQQVMLVSVPNDIINKYKNIFRNAGLKLTALEIEGISSSRILSAGMPENTLIIDIGSRLTSIFVAQNGFLKFAGQTDFAGGSLTQTISAGLNIRVRRAEDLKKRCGLTGSGGEYELSTLIMPMLDVIINEARRVVYSFESGYKEKIKSVILSGGGANLIGIEKYFANVFNLPIAKADPFSKVIYPAEIDTIVKELGPSFAVALGLGVKEF